ncbi:hypothetical protein YT1_4914 [Rhodococcus ruber]|nr:hypothetical protein YT1_4914 [Rhodococcus ruber]
MVSFVAGGDAGDELVGAGPRAAPDAAGCGAGVRGAVGRAAVGARGGSIRGLAGRLLRQAQLLGLEGQFVVDALGPDGDGAARHRHSPGRRARRDAQARDALDEIDGGTATVRDGGGQLGELLVGEVIRAGGAGSSAGRHARPFVLGVQEARSLSHTGATLSRIRCAPELWWAMLGRPVTFGGREGAT